MTIHKHKHPALKNTHLLFVFLLLFYSPLFGQKYNSALIENVSFKFNSENVEITYDITDARPDALFSVNIEFYKDPGELLNTENLTGDIGASVKGGAGKKIIWKSRKDGYIIDGNAYVKIKAKSEAYIPVGSHIAKSLFVPGWGDYRICNGKYHFIYGVAAYGSLGASIVYFSLANTNRQNYLNCMEIDKRNNFYNTYTNQKTLSYVFAATAAAIWVYDIVKVAVKSSRLKKSITPEQSKYYYDISQKVIAGTSRVQYLNTKTSYDLAMDDAKILFDNKDYVASRNAYEKAFNMSPLETLPKEKIAEIDKILSEIKSLNEKYDAAEAKGDSLFNIGQYEAAKNAFNTALKFKPDEAYPKKKIADADNALKQIALENEYNDNISNGNKAFNEKDYETAKVFYNSALKLKPNEFYPKEKINQIVQILFEQEQKLKESKYKSLIVEADKLYGSKKYEAAIGKYNEAYNLTYNDYAWKMSSICEQKIKENEGIKISYWEEGRMKYVKATINEILPFDFLLDTGADHVLVTSDIFMTFYKGGVITDADIYDLNYYQIADGSSVVGLKFKIRHLKIGDLIVEDVDASVIDGANTNLLGQSVFDRFGTVTFDNINNVLIIKK